MKNFLDKEKKNKNSDKRSSEAKKDKKQQEDNEMPKGELVPTDKFKNMKYLKEFTTPRMPEILSAGDKNSYNSMNIEWGSLGVAFKKPIFMYMSSQIDILMNLWKKQKYLQLI